ncbi:hypothetical protein ACROYT_G030723 [Oculina patagonica]
MADEVTIPNGVRYLCLFAQEHVDFKISELLSISAMFDFMVHVQYQDHRRESPYLVIVLPNEKCGRNLLSRAVSIKSVYELWGQGNNLTDLKQSVLQYPAEKMKAFTSSSSSFKLSIESFNKKLTVHQQRELIDQFQFLPFQGRVNLTAPDHVFSVLLDYGDDPNEAPPDPDRVFFGRLIGHGQRSLLKQYSLKTRKFIGNTSMDPQLSFLMANQGLVRTGSLVFDPFVGTGSVLVSCSHFGAHVIGSDIDYTIIHGRGKSSRANRKGQWRAQDENFRANFSQYGLASYFVDVLVADAGRLGLREVPLFDAIITDHVANTRRRETGGFEVVAEENMAAEGKQGKDAQTAKKSGAMKWSEMHDVYLCREILFIKPYQFKSGSTHSGNAWTSIANDLCAVEEISFTVNQKSVRDRYRLLLDKHKKKMRAQESESGSTTDETELDKLLENILEETEEALSSHDKETKEKQGKELLDRKKAEEVRQKALESLGQTQKRHGEEKDDCLTSKKKPRKSGTETMMYLQTKAEKEFELRKEEMQLKRQDMEYQKEMQLEAIRKQNSTSQNMEKMFEHFQAQQLSLQQQLMQQQQQYQQMQMKQAQQQQQMQQQQSQLLFTLLEKMSKN